MKATEQYFPVVLFIMLYKVVLTFESVDEIINCGHSNESYWEVVSFGAVWLGLFFEVLHCLNLFVIRTLGTEKCCVITWLLTPQLQNL